LILFSLVSIAGIPPFPVFFIKMCSVIALSSLFIGSRLYIFFIMLFSVFILLGYLKFCFSLIINVFTNQQSFIFSF
jgi:formate hydrogenlyase subunit 3/multisubunit Na+/H+ antiporter MnhD subunit